ncbi:MAG: hypothetical protein K2Q22_16520, partial [Cytophagales bacterium]|nr:hypothetical protein [Cytophagales bacterium]
MKRGILSLLLVWSWASGAFAQSASDLELLYLKNGSIIKGIILQKDTLGEVQIFTAEGHTFTYPYTDVLQIKPFSPPPPEPVASQEPERQVEPPKERKGLYLLGKGGILPNGLYSFYLSTGFRINSQIHLGIGTGYDSYPDIQYGIIPNFNSTGTHARDGFLPLYFDARFFLNKEPTAMFIYLNVGYSWLTTTGKAYTRDSSSQTSQNQYRTFNGGTFAVTGFGLKFAISKKTSMFIDIGIRIQNYSTEIFQR